MAAIIASALPASNQKTADTRNSIAGLRIDSSTSPNRARKSTAGSAVGLSDSISEGFELMGY
jgi:hypothetical protein